MNNSLFQTLPDAIKDFLARNGNGLAGFDVFQAAQSEIDPLSVDFFVCRMKTFQKRIGYLRALFRWEGHGFGDQCGGFHIHDLTKNNGLNQCFFKCSAQLCNSLTKTVDSRYFAASRSLIIIQRHF